MREGFVNVKEMDLETKEKLEIMTSTELLDFSWESQTLDHSTLETGDKHRPNQPLGSGKGPTVLANFWNLYFIHFAISQSCTQYIHYIAYITK